MATEVATAEGAAARVTPDDRPYSPSWVDFLMRRIAALPGPTWLAYLIALPVCMFIASAEGWLGSVSTFPEIDLAQAAFGLFFIAPLAVLHFLDKSAADAWDRFRPVTDLDDGAAAGVRYELTVTPARVAWVLLAVGVLFNALWYVADPIGTQIDGRPAAFVVARGLIEGFISATVFVLVYQLIRQLRIVDHLHDAATRIDLFQPQAVHAMSRLTARSAIAIIVLAVFLSWPYPGIAEQTLIATILLFTLPMIVLGVAAFFLPLRGLHDRLVEDRAELQAATSQRLEATRNALHQLVDSESVNTGDVEKSREAQTRIDALSKAQTALIQERDLLAKLSTWPWDPSTLRAVISAIALPIVLFLITRVLDRFV